MIRCPFCNALYTDSEAVCPICGRPLPREEQQSEAPAAPEAVCPGTDETPPQPDNAPQPQPSYSEQPQPPYGEQPQPPYGEQPQPPFGEQPQPPFGDPAPQENAYAAGPAQWGCQPEGVGMPPAAPQPPAAENGSLYTPDPAAAYRLDLNTIQTLGILSICLAAMGRITGLVLGIVGLSRANRLREQARHPLAQEEVRRARRLNIIGIVIAAVMVAFVAFYIFYIVTVALTAFRYGFENALGDSNIFAILPGLR